MEFGLYLRSFVSDSDRPLHEQIDDAIEICKLAQDVGFSAVTMPQHWVSHPTIWPQPFPMLARLAPEVREMRLMTGILQLPLHNPVQIAEDTATVDHISKGRLILGIAIGYRETELEAAGTTRAERVDRLTESVELMKRLWSGDVVNFDGRFWHLHEGRMGFVPVQRPHPPIWLACQSHGAIRRAGRIANACYLGPQVGLNDLPGLINVYRLERKERNLDRGLIAVSRGVSFADGVADAIEQAREAASSSYRTYSTWNMQESSMVRIHTSPDSEIQSWAVVGGSQECIDGFAQLDRQGVQFVNVTFLNLPSDLSARKHYLRKFGETVLQPVQDSSGNATTGVFSR